MTVSSADHHDLSVVCEAQAYQKVDHLAEEGEGGGCGYTHCSLPLYGPAICNQMMTTEITV